MLQASNPGQFESDVELCWQRGLTQESIFHTGRVGINTDRPDESLVVHGNLKISGHIIQPSDSRAKKEISELDTSQQLQNVKRIRVVKYRYEPEFAVHSGLADLMGKDSNGKSGMGSAFDIVDTGVIAQEIREVLPDAVQEAGSVLLPNGDVIDNFLLVNKDRIYMENIGAVKELCKVTGSLETRIEQLEQINSRLIHVQKIGISNSSYFPPLKKNHQVCFADRQKEDCTHTNCKANDPDQGLESCSNKLIQFIIVVLVVVMAVWYMSFRKVWRRKVVIFKRFLSFAISSLAAISTLYFVEHSKQSDRYMSRYEINQLTLNGAGVRNRGRGGTKDRLNSGGGIYGFDQSNWPHTESQHQSMGYTIISPTPHKGRVDRQKTKLQVLGAITTTPSPITRLNATDLPRKSTRSPAKRTGETLVITQPNSDLHSSHIIPSSSSSSSSSFSPPGVPVPPIDLGKKDDDSSYPQRIINGNAVKRPKPYSQQEHDQAKNFLATAGVPALPPPFEQSSSDNNVDSGIPLISEHNELNWTSHDNGYLLTDVYTNLIDVGQSATRNDSELHIIH